jgi:hypothetical protein
MHNKFMKIPPDVLKRLRWEKNDWVNLETGQQALPYLKNAGKIKRTVSEIHGTVSVSVSMGMSLEFQKERRAGGKNMWRNTNMKPKIQEIPCRINKKKSSLVHMADKQ